MTFSWHCCLPSIHPVSDFSTGYVWGGQVSDLSSATISRLVLRSRSDLGLLSDWGWSGRWWRIALLFHLHWLADALHL